jgi:hypothetical protein
MKKILVILVLLIAGNTTYSQSYNKLISTDKYWDVYTRVNPDWCATWANRIYFTGADTVIDGFVYKISKQYFFQQVIIPGPFCPPYVIMNTAYNTQQYIREDTIAKKVYIYCTECYPPVDDLFYDFSLNIGDTLHSFFAGLGSTLVCTSIQNFTLQNGSVRKKFNFYYPYQQDAFYIEGIGGAYGLFHPIIPPFEASAGYFCISENDTTLYGDQCYYYFVGMNNVDNFPISISPNPAHDYVNITIKHHVSECIFILFNMQGQIIFNKILKNQFNDFSISNIKPGIYSYKINSDLFVKQGKICIF